jgi:hypothetical protein
MTVQRTPEQEVFYERIRAHLTDLTAKSHFTARLAKENGWSSAFAQAVIEEYAKFLFIAREGGHPVAPPPKIDLAWHLHLLYTKEYWSDFCPNVLGFKLEHSPHTGNPADGEKFDDWASQTRQSYRKFFGIPNRIWMPPKPEPNQAVLGAGIATFIVGLFMFLLSNTLQLPLFGYVVGIALALVGVFIMIKAHIVQPAGASKGDGGCGTFSSCGSSDASSFNSDSGGGGHGGGHSCGGHSCGGHGCGGGGH